jgi:hypothetical protein
VIFGIYRNVRKNLLSLLVVRVRRRYAHHFTTTRRPIGGRASAHAQGGIS